MDSVSRQRWLKALEWRQGEHVVIVGPTGSGKTTLARELLLKRDWPVVLAIKRYDETLEAFKKDYHVIKKWPPAYAQRRVLIWLKPKTLADIPKQRAQIAQVLDSIYIAGGYSPYFDDAGYIAGTLGLGKHIVVILNQGRSSGISGVLSMTRPSSALAHVPLEAMTQVRHTLLFALRDDRERKRAAEIAGMPSKMIHEAMDAMGPHDFLAIDAGRNPVIVGA